MGKKDKKRSAEEAGLVEVATEATSSAGVGMPTADQGEISTMSVDVEGAVKKKKSKKDKSSKKDKEGKESSSSSRKEKEKDLEIPADHLSPIAHPLAGKKLAKKTLKTVKKVHRLLYNAQSDQDLMSPVLSRQHELDMSSEVSRKS
jgi:H/ACA ribonucleoprotein complex subunit 2